MGKRFVHSISVRMVVLFVLFFSLCLSGAFAFMYFEVSGSLEESEREVITSRWQEIALFLRTTGDRAKMNHYLDSAEEQLENEAYLIHLADSRGNLVFFKRAGSRTNDTFTGGPEVNAFPKREPGWHPRQEAGAGALVDILANSVGPELQLQVGKSTAGREKMLEKTAYTLAGTAAGFAILSVFIGLFYAKSALRPVQKLIQTVRSIEGGNLSHRVPVSGARDELQELGESFNRMIDRVEKLVIAMRGSLDDIAHDIRTPLTRIRNVAEAAILSKAPGAAERALEECAENISEISSFFDQLLDIAEAEAGAVPLHLESVSIGAVFEEVAELYQLVAEEKKIQIQLGPVRDLLWTLDRNRIKRALANLVDNAVKFSPEGTVVLLSAYASGQLLTIEVSDQGPGVPAQDLSRIWERLYRGDKSRSIKGSGLGLALVRSIVVAHGGEVYVKAAPTGGSVFGMRLPSAKAPA